MQLSRRQYELTLALCRAGLQQAGNDFALARDLVDLGEAVQAEVTRLAQADADKATLARASQLLAAAKG